MKGLPFVLTFTALTFVSWGAYGPVLHHGAVALDHDSMRAFVGVGFAYFLIAVLLPLFILKRSGESGQWTVTGIVYSLVAGAVGAVGALGVILALGYGGKTVYVMPLVFGFAPVVNTLVTATMSRTFNQIRPIFIGGIVAAALGAGGVLFFKPVAQPAAAPEQQASAESGVEKTAQDAGAAESGANDEQQDPTGQETAKAATTSLVGIIISVIIAALCWGAYGPMLHIGQGKMGGSRLRPFACVGISYFVIAVAVPLVLIYSRTSASGSWDPIGMIWSFLAGVAGAVGALGVILAFNAGGKPYYVMPLIFGMAPVVNTFISLSEAGTWSQVQWMFWVSLAVVIAGAVTVLLNAPKPAPKPKPAAAPAEASPIG